MCERCGLYPVGGPVNLHIDFEVYSEVDIREAPLDVYASHPSTQIILCAWALDAGPVTVWERDTFTPKPARELLDALYNPDVMIHAWNANYERTVLRCSKSKMDLPIQRWTDVMALARYVGLPGKLKDCAQVPMIGVPASDKTKSETLLINRFCKPNKDGRRVMPHEYPDDWKLFVEYCRKDVLTMRHIQNWIEPRFPFPASERAIWELDQTINDRGLPVDVAMAKRAQEEVKKILADSFNKQRFITGLENPNSVQQLLPWLQKRGYPFDSLGKEFLERALQDHRLGDVAPEVVKLRLDSAKSSVKKFKALAEETSPDGRLRHQFKYYGAHTGRWSGRGVQPQNLTRKETDKEALRVLTEDYVNA